MFSNFVFHLALLSASPSVYSPCSLLQVLFINFIYSLSIKNFCYELYLSRICSYVILFLLPPVADLFLCTLIQPFRRIFFRYFRMPRFICIVLCWPVSIKSSSFTRIFCFIFLCGVVKLICGCLWGCFLYIEFLNVSPSLVVSLVAVSIYKYICTERVFPTKISWWSFTRFWVTVSRSRSPGHFCNSLDEVNSSSEFQLFLPSF